MRLLVISDLHHHRLGPDRPGRGAQAGVEFLRRVLQTEANDGYDALLLLGDLIDDGHHPDATAALTELADAIAEATAETPVLVVPGNHDGDADAVFAAFGTRPGGHVIGPLRFYVFADAFDGDLCTRAQSDRRAFAAFAAEGDGPLIVVQHSPVCPEIPLCQGGYPYMHTNRQEVLGDYSCSGVRLSLSGHFHPGQPTVLEGGVVYKTVASLCETPYAYTIVNIEEEGIFVDDRQLALPAEQRVWDCHAHTEYAYCAADATAAHAVARSRQLGLAGLCLVEHAPQLYCPADDFWAARHVREPGCWRTSSPGRMEAYLQDVGSRRDAQTRIGLEIEVDRVGQPVLRQEDRSRVDLLVGAVHWLNDDRDVLSEEAFVTQFLASSRALIEAGINVLAHPFRIFGRRHVRRRRELYRPLAELLAESNVAAEVNFHINDPDPAFFSECLEAGVKIAFGSDAHSRPEAGALSRHLRLLRSLAGRDDVSALMYRPP